MKYCNISKPTYLSSVQELIDAGYLVNTSGNHYDFYEKLPEDTITVTIKK